MGPGSNDDPDDIGNGNEIAMVWEFPYLGSMISTSCSVDTEVSRRLAKASQVFRCIREPVFLCRHLSMATKMSVVLSTLLYGVETWTVKVYEFYVHTLLTYSHTHILIYT